jgi:uncharacterized protein YndB with AHSA1/START domain
MKHKLNVTTPSDREIVMTRQFNAPRQLVFDAMTKPELIRRWLFAPPGWAMTVCEDDARVGGTFRWEWASAGGPAMAMHGVYREVVPPERIVRTETFDTGCAPQAGEQIVTLTLTEQGGQTLLTLTILYPSKEARDATIASGMERGVAAGYDNLDELLAA